MTEAQLQRAVLELAGWLRLRAYHTHDSRRSQRGFPDIVCVGPHGLIWAELKSASGTLTDDQWSWQYALLTAGQRAYVWRPCDWPEPIETQLRSIA